MGYTTSHTYTLIGLGCSSISDTWTAFAQNSKTVEEYIKEVNNGNTPVFRGHILNEEDLILRKHILNIMCRMETSFDSESFGMTPIQEGIQRLQQLIKDNLVCLTENVLQIKEEGRPFLRNICMAFDARLHSNKEQKIMFSKTV
jgi:oxygen-independent coproporphyrinogen-3 oxidase